MTGSPHDVGPAATTKAEPSGAECLARRPDGELKPADSAAAELTDKTEANDASKASDKSEAANFVKDALAITRDSFVVIGALMFFVGYVYRYTYMHALGIPAHATQSPVNELAVYAIAVVSDERLWLSVFVAAVAIAFAAMWYCLARSKSDPATTRRWFVAFAVAVSLSTIPVGKTAADAAALLDASDVRRGHVLPAIHMDITTEGAKALATEPILLKAAKLGALYVIDETSDTYYVVLQGRTDEGVASGTAVAFRVPKKYIAATRTTLPSDL